MRVGHLGCHEESEVIIVVNIRITKSHLLDAATSVECLLQQNWIDGWIDVFLNILYQNGTTVADASADLTEEVVLPELHQQ